MMFAADVCALPTTGGATGVAVAAIFLLVLGVIVARWVRASAGRVSIVAVVPLLLLGIGAAMTQPSSTSCNSSTVTTTVPEVTTTVPLVTTPPTTSAPVKSNLILQIDVPPLSVTNSLQGLVTVSDSVPNPDELVFELGLFGTVNVHVDWGDNKSDDVTVAGPLAHTYATSGRYTITVSGTLTGFGQVFGAQNVLRGAEYLTAVHSFGDIGIENLSNAFWGANNLIKVPRSLPATVTSMESMFFGATSFDQPIGGWNTSNVTNMIYMFFGASSFNESLSSWNTSNVTNMRSMFFGATSFDQPIGGWDTSSVEDMSSMFFGAAKFDRPIGDWDTSNVVDMSAMFSGATSFNQSLGSWNIDLVSNMANMLVNSALSVANYDATLIGWEDGTKQRNVYLGATGLSFSSLGSNARQLLICMASWQISGDYPLLESTSVDNDQIVAAGC